MNLVSTTRFDENKIDSLLKEYPGLVKSRQKMGETLSLVKLLVAGKLQALVQIDWLLVCIS